MQIQNHDFDSSLPKTTFWGDEVFYLFHGFWFPPVFVQGAQQILNHFKTLPNDIILASYPKTGTTWLKSLLYSIVNRSSEDQLTKHHPHELVPTLELQVYGPLAKSPPPFATTNTNPSPSPRILSTHLPYQIFGKTINPSECKVVYIARNPKDTLVSLWHFMNTMDRHKSKPWPLEDAVDKFCKGVVPDGPYYDHVLGYHKESIERPKKFFLVTYEELKKDTKTHVKRLAEFLGCPFDDQDQVEEVVRGCSIEALKKNEVNRSSDVPSWSFVPYDSFFRKGQVGDHKNYLTKDMIERIDAVTREKFCECYLEERLEISDMTATSHDKV